LSRVVHLGLQRDLDRRIPSVRALLEKLDAFAGGSDRVVAAQLVGLTEPQRGELAVKVSSSDSAARRVAAVSKSTALEPSVQETFAAPNLSRSAKDRATRDASTGAGKGTMLGVAVLSAAIAGGSAYFFARGREPAAPIASSAAPTVAASVQVLPADARVSTPAGAVPVSGGVATLRGKPGEALSVTVQHGPASKTFSVSLGSDGIATPGRLVLTP
jgi:hypothetical protein